MMRVEKVIFAEGSTPFIGEKRGIQNGALLSLTPQFASPLISDSESTYSEKRRRDNAPYLTLV